jgi:hypothetical protein
VLNSLHRGAASEEPINFVTIIVLMIVFLVSASSSVATTQGLNQIATPDVQAEGTLALSFDVQDRKIGNPYQVQAEMGLTKWFEIDIFQGFKPNDSVIENWIALKRNVPVLHWVFELVAAQQCRSATPRSSRLLFGSSRIRRWRDPCRFS